MFYPNLFTEALARKRRKLYPPDQLANGPDRFLKPVASQAPMVASYANWAAVVGNQAIPAVDPTTLAVERGYWEELPWDE